MSILYRKILRPLLFCLDPELVHELVVSCLLARGHPLLRRHPVNDHPQLKVNVAGLEFPNRIGLAAGMDKDAHALAAWAALGFGFVEVGTVTHQAQVGNPKPRLFRLVPEKSLLNRMGFNNRGAEVLRDCLQKASRRIPVGVNIGKSRRVDPENEEAVLDDYQQTLSIVQEQADYLAINVSSPNTPGLRSWEAPERLRGLLGVLRPLSDKPLFVKLSADLDYSQIDQVLEIADSLGLAGVIATNTTLSREGAPAWTREQAGGISGALLAQRSLEITRYIGQHRPKNLALISVGGIATADQVKERVDLGADLVQVYTAFVYQGVDFISTLNRELSELL